MKIKVETILVCLAITLLFFPLIYSLQITDINRELSGAYRSEIRAILVGSASITGSINWDVVAQNIKNAGADIMVISAGELTYSRYPSSFTASHSGTDHVASAIQSAHNHGLECHIKFNLLTASPSSEYNVVICDKNTGQLYSDSWACPVKTHDLLINIAEELATNYPDMDGFQFDYIRYELREMCYCDDCKARFIADNPECADVNWAEDVAIIGGNAGKYFEKFIEWRTHPVNDLVHDFRAKMVSINPNIEFSAAVFPYASALSGQTYGYPGYQRYWLGQDTGFWIKEGWLDWVAPMTYTSNLPKLEGYMTTFQHYTLGGSEGIIPVAFYLANCYPSTVPIADFKQQIDKCREIGADGWNIWRYGGPGDGSTSAPDVKTYLDMVDMSPTFKITDLSVTPYEDKAQITWQTDIPATTTVEWSDSPLFTATYTYDERTGSWTNEKQYYWHIDHNEGNIVEDSTKTESHEVTITGLEEGKKYYFRVQSEGSGIATTHVLTFWGGGEAPPDSNGDDNGGQDDLPPSLSPPGVPPEGATEEVKGIFEQIRALFQPILDFFTWLFGG